MMEHGDDRWLVNIGDMAIIWLLYAIMVSYGFLLWSFTYWYGCDDDDDDDDVFIFQRDDAPGPRAMPIQLALQVAST